MTFLCENSFFLIFPLPIFEGICAGARISLKSQTPLSFIPSGNLRINSGNQACCVFLLTKSISIGKQWCSLCAFCDLLVLPVCYQPFDQYTMKMNKVLYGCLCSKTLKS